MPRYPETPASVTASVRRWPIITLLACVLAMSTAPVAGASEEPVFVFNGGGWGHSSGMSQYGAYGMALEGHSYEEILANYYPGLTRTEADSALTASPIWVGLAQEQNARSITVRSTGAEEAHPVTVTQGGSSFQAEVDETITVVANADGTCTSAAPGGSLTGECWVDVEWDGFADSPTTRMVVGSTSYARGRLHVRPDNNTATFALSLEIDIEDYMLGLAEMPASWGANGGMEALKAQAVAGRSFALNRVGTRGSPASRTWCWCQVYDTTVDQAYAGWRESAVFTPWLEAVAATAGEILGPDASHPSFTPYSSSSFGWTETGSDDHWALKPEVRNPYGRWTVSYTASELASRLGMTDVTGIRATGCSAVTGSIKQITFSGTGGDRVLSTHSLKSLLGFRSPQVVHIGSPPAGPPPCPGPGLIPSDEQPIPVVAPSAPDQLTGSARDGRIIWTWEAPEASGGEAVSDYLIEYRVEGSAEWVRSDDGSGDGRRYAMKGLENGTRYEARVSAVNSAGAGNWSSVATATPKAPAPTPESSPEPASSIEVTAFLEGNRNLRLGSSGTPVMGLQEFLANQGFKVGPVDGRFGVLTMAAVVAFQRSQGLHTDGIVGPVTRNAARSIHEESDAGEPPHTHSAEPTGPTSLLSSNRLLRRGSSGAEVLELQQFLRDRGFRVGPIDGKFGVITLGAVVAFQGTRGIATDGIVGPVTRDAIRKLAQ